MLDRGADVIIATPQTCTFPYGANMAFRACVLRESGGFRTDLGATGNSLRRGEDTELVSRLGDAGKRIVYVPNAVVRHKVSPERMRMRYFRRWKFNSGRSKEHVFPTANGGFPRWAIRESIEHGALALWHYARMDRVRAIEQELLFWSAVGQTVGIMERRWKR
jgi:GT2 family glycosyltransferase